MEVELELLVVLLREAKAGKISAVKALCEGLGSKPPIRQRRATGEAPVRAAVLGKKEARDFNAAMAIGGDPDLAQTLN